MSTPPPRESRRVAEVTPLAPERYKVQFTVSRETHDRLGEARDLLRHRIPDGDLAAIFDRALTVLLAELRKARHADVHHPRATSACGTGRHVPAAVKRAVWERDSGQCAFVGTAGRCTERGFLEYHHLVPYADGGPTTAANLELRCRATTLTRRTCGSELIRKILCGSGDQPSAVPDSRASELRRDHRGARLLDSVQTG